jgi:hypothetical protein
MKNLIAFLHSRAITKIKTASRIAGASLLAWICTSCASHRPEEDFVRQIIPIQIRQGTPVMVEIHCLGANGVNNVGIRGAAGLWQVLTNGTRSVEVRLASSNKEATEVGGLYPGTEGAAFVDSSTNVHYLFYVAGRLHANAWVQITFPDAPPGVTPAEIVVCNVPPATTFWCVP